MSASLELAHLLLSQGRYDLAERQLALVLAEQPDLWPAHAMLALCLADTKRFEAAERHARQAVLLAPDAPQAHGCLGRVLMVRNDLVRAEEAAAEALRWGPNDEDNHVLVGQLHLLQHRWQPALQEAQAALALQPECVDAKLLLAEALRQGGRPGLAEAELRATLALAPEDALAHCNLGWTLLHSQQNSEAMHHFREALRLDPELEAARQGVLETLKARNFLYRGMLQYSLWMGRLGRRRQWSIVLGLWIAYLIVGHVADIRPTLRPWLSPLLIGYLVFVATTWLAQPLSNLALQLHPFGRLALSPDERRASAWIGSTLLAGVISGIALLCFPGRGLGYLTLYFVLMLLPLTAMFRAEAPWPRRPLAIYTLVVAVVGLGGVVFVALPHINSRQLPISYALGFLVLAVCTLAFPVLALLSSLAGNILNSIRWRR